MGRKSGKKSRHNDKIMTERIAAEEIMEAQEEETVTKDAETDEAEAAEAAAQKAETVKAEAVKADAKEAAEKEAGADKDDTVKAEAKEPEAEEPKAKEAGIKETEAEETEAKEAGSKESEAKEAEAKESGSKESEAKEVEADSDLYNDEVYRDQDSSDDDMVFLDISGSGVKVIPSPGQEEKRERGKITISIDTEALSAWLLVLVSSAVLISLAFNNNVWLDEAFTATLVHTDMAGVIQRSMADTLPPLYNIILKLTTDIFGYTVPVMKLTSVVPMILTMMLGATVVRKRFGGFTSYIFILAVMAMPNMMFYGVEIRMYSLGFLFATAAGIFAYEVIASPCRKNWILFTLSSVLAGYSHHFAFVAAGFLYLFLLIYACIEQKKFANERDRKLHPIILTSMVKCIFATFLLYLPCLLVTIRQIKSVSGYFSMPEVTLPVFIKYCRYPFTVGFTPLSIILLSVSCAVFIMLCIRISGSGARFGIGSGRAEQNGPNTDTIGERDTSKVRNIYIMYCFIVHYLVLLFGTAVSSFMTANIFVDRYLFFSLGLLWLSFAVGTGSFKKPLICCIIMFELIVGVYSYTQAFTSEYAPGADEMTGWLDENVSDGDSLLTLEDYEELAWCLPFYNDKLTNYETFGEAVASAGSHNVWVAVMNGYDEGSAGSPFSENKGYAAFVKEADEAGYYMEYEGVFRFDRYIFKMYRLAHQQGSTGRPK